MGGWAACGLVCVAVVWIYWSALDGSYLWDDGDQFAAVEAVADPHGLWRIWYPITEDGVATPQYYPLSFSAFWLLRQTAGQWTLPYHVTNLLLHLANVCLLYAIFRRFVPRHAIWGAAFFAVHPVLVPAVAWMCQLRNCLSLHLALWSVLAWMRYEESNRRTAYALSLGLFAAALLSKTAVAPLPMVLLLAYTWLDPRRRRVWELAPMFALALVMATVTIAYERLTGASRAEFTATWSERFARMGWIGLFHLKQTIWPLPTSFVYPRWTIDATKLVTFVPLAVGVALLGITFWLDRRVVRGIFCCLLCYAALLFPVLGVFNVFFMRYSWVADHWQYPAVPAIAAAVVLLLYRWRPDRSLPTGATVGLVCALAVFTGLSRARAERYQNPTLIWEHTLAINPNGWLPNNNYGYQLEHENRFDAALVHYQRAAAADPDKIETLFNLGRLYRKLGDDERAEAVLLEALERDPQMHVARLSLSSLYVEQGRLDDAADQNQQILLDHPGYAAAHYNLGVIADLQSRRAEAIEYFRAAVQSDAGFVDAHRRLAAMLLEENQPDAAARHFSTVTRLAADDPVPWFGLGVAEAAAGNLSAAVSAYRKALRLRPVWPEVANNLAVLLAEHPRLSPGGAEEAVELARQACDATDYQNAGMLHTLMIAHRAAGQHDEARKIGERVIQLAEASGQDALAQQTRQALQNYDRSQNGSSVGTP